VARGGRWPSRWSASRAPGFAGLAVDLGARRAPTAAELAPLLWASGLRSQVFCFVCSPADLSAALRYAATIGAEAIVGCGQVFPASVEEAAAQVRGWLVMAGAAGVPMQLETHRYTLTNDLGFTTRLLDALPELEIAADLSHYVVGNELPDGPDDRVEALLARVLDRAGSLQGRVATRGRCRSRPACRSTPPRRNGSRLVAAGMRRWRSATPQAATSSSAASWGPRRTRSPASTATS